MTEPKVIENVYVSKLEVLPPEYIDNANTVKLYFYTFDGKKRTDYGPYYFSRRDALEGTEMYIALLMALLSKKKINLKVNPLYAYLIGIVIDDSPE
ncbi:hypothetical protein ACP179_16095 [Xenorhabdus stockiae]|uniref:hypothetical protein n=1 Tax=Xenorhabdus stockiae TaxID=351614 RepID=UPI003CEC3F90